MGAVPVPFAAVNCKACELIDQRAESLSTWCRGDLWCRAGCSKHGRSTTAASSTNYVWAYSSWTRQRGFTVQAAGHVHVHANTSNAL